MDNYEEQAEKFLRDTGTTIECVKLGTFPYFPDDTEARDVFQITLQRNEKSYSFRFGDSIHNTLNRLLKTHTAAYVCQLEPDQKLFRHTHTKNATQFHGWCKKNYKRLRAVPSQPTSYAVLAALTKYDPGSFRNFCGEYGCDEDSMKAHRAYLAVQEEWAGVERLFGDVLEELSEIN